MTNPTLSGLYAITDASITDPATLAHQVDLAIAGGARVIQYRDKSQNRAQRTSTAHRLVETCQTHGVALIINDDIELAQTCNAAGVHLGREDGAVAEARERLPSQAIIGVSCYDSLELAQSARQAGANYVAFGRFFPSKSKPGASPAELSILSQARNQIDLPIVAIGGITPDNGRTLLDAGADMLAVINGVFGQPDICAAAAQYAALFNQNNNEHRN